MIKQTFLTARTLTRMTSLPPLPIASAEQSSGSLQIQTAPRAQGVTVSSAGDSSLSEVPPSTQTHPHFNTPYSSAIPAFSTLLVYRQPPEALRSLSNSAGFPPQLYNSSIVPPTHESISAGLLPSFGSRERTDTSIANTFSLASSSPTFSARELTCLRHSTVLRHPQPNTSLLLSHSASNSTASAPRDPPPLSRSPDYPYASPGVPIPFPPYQTLPNPELSTSQLNLQRLAVEVNG